MSTSDKLAVAREIQAFAQGVIKAQNESDLIAAGRHLGRAVAIVEVDLVVALLLKEVERPAGRAAHERNVVSQALQRKTDLPSGTTQKLMLDVRGQNVPLSEVKKILANIETKSAGAISQSNINVIW